MTIKVSLRDARRVALAAQGFGLNYPTRPTAAHLRRVLGRLGLFQIDSVNVVARAQRGEAGYAGGILSAAVGGIKVGEAVASSLLSAGANAA